MSQRSRPRNASQQQHANEEIEIKNGIMEKLQKLNVIQKRQFELVENLKAKEQEIVEFKDKYGHDSSKLLAELDVINREIMKLSGEEVDMLSGSGNLIQSAEVLAALCRAPQGDTSSQRAGPSKIRKNKPGPTPQVEASIDSPGPSPGFSGRLKGSSGRSGSVVRDGKDVMKSDDDGAKGISAEKAGKFVVNAEVAYKLSKPKEDGGDWIQCIIRSVTEVGNKKRYEVQDPEPDENGTQGDVFKASAAQLIAIPPAGTPLPDYAVGRIVLARYPETTTFYRAKVLGLKKDSYRLKFDDDAGNEMEVDKRTTTKYTIDYTFIYQEKPYVVPTRGNTLQYIARG